MSQFLFQYHAVSPTTWVYLSSLLMVGLFFKFSRFWSVRNLDLIMLILLAPGLLLIHFGQVQRNALTAELSGGKLEVAELEVIPEDLNDMPDGLPRPQQPSTVTLSVRKSPSKLRVLSTGDTRG